MLCTLRFVLCASLLAGCASGAATQQRDTRRDGVPAAAVHNVPFGQKPDTGNSDPLQHARASINTRDLLLGIETLASDAFEGRAPGTHGETLTVDWLKARFRAIGLQPAGDNGGWTQTVPLVAYTSQSTLTVNVHGKSRVLSPSRDFVAWSPVPLTEVAVDNSELVFVGYGVIAPEFGWNDFKGMDLRGKTLLMLVNDPQVVDRANPDRLDTNLFRGEAMTYYGRWTYKYEMAARLGAAAVLIIHEPAQAGYPWQVVVNSWGQENYVLQSATANTDYPLIPGWIEGGQARSVLAAAGYDLDVLKAQAARPEFHPVKLGVQASFRVQNRWRELHSVNVVGRIAGSDPRLRDQTVVYTAHWDHFGRDERRSGDKIFHGAIDNAAGVSGMLQIAQAMTQASPAPRRSVVFMATTAEERGLLGARWYVRHPLYALDKTVANINIDGINAFGRSTGVDVIGYGANSLEDMLVEAALTQGREVFPEARPELGLMYRSDQFEFSRVGVPSLFMTAHPRLRGRSLAYARERIESYGLHDYHTPRDVVRPDWDLSGAVEDLQLLLDVGYRCSVVPGTPHWKQGAEFHRP